MASASSQLHLMTTQRVSECCNFCTQERTEVSAELTVKAFISYHSGPAGDRPIDREPLDPKLKLGTWSSLICKEHDDMDYGPKMTTSCAAAGSYSR